jgi:hypothetical protein
VNISIPDVTACTAAGLITNGADCGTINSQVHSSMSGDDYIAWLNASASHASAICTSADDFGDLITMTDEMCTVLKTQCSQEMRSRIATSKAILHGNWKKFARTK